MSVLTTLWTNFLATAEYKDSQMPLMADLWYVPTNYNPTIGAPDVMNAGWVKGNTPGSGPNMHRSFPFTDLGMSHSSGVFSFPVPGIYRTAIAITLLGDETKVATYAHDVTDEAGTFQGMGSSILVELNPIYRSQSCMKLIKVTDVDVQKFRPYWVMGDPDTTVEAQRSHLTFEMIKRL